MQEHVSAIAKDLKEQLEENTRARARLTKALEAVQALCVHFWRYEGSGHNDDLYVCDHCGMSEFR